MSFSAIDNLYRYPVNPPPAAMSVIVTTHNGRVEGRRERGSSIFRGIAFARPPVGPLRFRAPQPAQAWTGVLDATRVPPSAPQIPLLMPDIPPRSEDCLYLNVFTPGADGKKRPVMVWLHGGGFLTGSGGQSIYEGDRLAERGNLVVVTVNYRLGVLGFGYLKELVGAGHAVDANPGLRDQIAALQWVRDNIEDFGGDPDNVTLFGESAGAMSVGCLLSAPGASGLFHRAIAQSGAAHHYALPDQATHIAGAFLRGLGISESQAGRLWRVSVDEILKAQQLCALETIRRGPAGKQMVQMEMTLIPVADGEVLPHDPLEAIAAGSVRDVPLLVGSTLDEWNFFIFLTDPRKQTLDDAALVKVIERRLPGHGPGAADYYRQALDGERKREPWEVFGAFETDRSFRVPAIRLAEMQSAQQEKTFMYLFDWRSPLAEGRMGSCHAIDLPFVFGNVDGEFGRMFSGGGPAARTLSQKVMDAWIAFARCGDPGHDEIGPWPRYDAARRATKVLADRCRVLEAPLDARRAFWDGLT